MYARHERYPPSSPLVPTPRVRKQGAYAERGVVCGLRYEQLRACVDVRLLCLAKVTPTNFDTCIYFTLVFVHFFMATMQSSNFPPLSVLRCQV